MCLNHFSIKFWLYLVINQFKMKNDNYPTTNRVGDPPLSRQASHSIYSILEYEDHQNPNLPVNPNSLRYTDIGMNKRYKQSLYISRSGRMLSRETKSNLLIFYIFLTCWLIISFATWILLYNQQNSNDDHLMVRLIFLGGILVASYATIYML